MAKARTCALDGIRDALKRLDEQVPGWLAQLDAIAGGLGGSTPMDVTVIEAVKNLLEVAHSRRR